jgi:hypothetical protein
MLSFRFSLGKTRYLPSPTTRRNTDESALRKYVSELIHELALRDDALAAAEDEIDALRHALGMREVPT